ncbi:transposase [Rhizobium sp. DKSPLA3]|uniref:Transposase n=1 Tax=Rhizobium quercicola TaxID=2901226 RepID=A0A9X1NQY6_9HYPH|nr:transposase [Rhizobium quercicola]MCD7109320.1 transposase [Rhizobium quercicola]
MVSAAPKVDGILSSKQKGRSHILLPTPGNAHDCKVAILEALLSKAESVANKSYDSQALREWFDDRGTQAIIPTRKNRKIKYEYDRATCKQRNVIERMFCRLKDWRRIATRFDRNIKNSVGAIELAATVICWLRVWILGTSERKIASRYC